MKYPVATAIGSLPHHNIDAALAFSFKLKLPFLPQIPAYHHWEYMIPQALDGLPGLHVSRDGLYSLDLSVWKGRNKGLDAKLTAAFSKNDAPEAFAAFEPTNSSTSCWQPFLWELEERRIDMAKIQIAGPLTCQWALKTDSGEPVSKHPEIGSQILKLILARAIAMTRRLRLQGVTPLIFIDEPGLYAIGMTEASTTPMQKLGLTELALFVKSLQKEGATVGIHCCSNTNWSAVLALGINILSIDAALSLGSLLEAREPLLKFIEAGGSLSLGVVPTHGLSAADLSDFDASEAASSLRARLQSAFGDKTSAVIKKLLLTPACGLALLGVEDSELILSALQGVESAFSRS